MKKFISIILSAAVITASAAVPVFADYTAASYDVEQFNYTFDEGTVTNDIDGTNALQIGETQSKVFDTSLDTTKEFYLGFDFRFDNANGNIQIPNLKSSGAVNKVGPIITYDGTNLRTQINSSNYQNLGEFSINTWYSAEIEGRTGIGQSHTTFRLYNYVDGEKKLVQETTSFSMRNISSEGRSFNGMLANDVSLDNIVLIRENPDRIDVSATFDEIDAGQTTTLDYVMYRGETEATKYSVTWSVWDESGENEITDGSVTVSSDGIVVANISSPTQIVTIKATAGDISADLVGSCQVAVNAVDTGDEKFNEVVIDGADEMKAGTSETFTFTASKNGEDVTADVTADDVVWSVYNCDDISENNNKYISVENGVLTVDDSVIPQTIHVRATSASGKVYGSKKVVINMSDEQKETVLHYDACETSVETAERVESIDGSTAYFTTNAHTVTLSNYSEYIATEFDFRMPESGDFRVKRRDGTENSSFVYRDGTISQQTGSSSFTSIMSGVDPEAWYHMELIYSSEAANAACNIYKYDEDGELTLVTTNHALDMRNGKEYGRFDFGTGIYLDNVKISIAQPTDITVQAPSQYIFAGDTAEFTANGLRNGLTLKGFSDFTWSVLDEDDLPIIDDTITINGGVLKVGSMAAPQTITVVAGTSSGAIDTADITIQTTEVFKVTNLGINEEGTKIVKLYVEKNFVYDDDVSFIIAIKNADGVLKAVKLINSFGDRYSLGENAITVDFELPADFNAETDVVETMVWTAL